MRTNYTKVNQLYAEKCILIANEMLGYINELTEDVDIITFYNKVARIVKFLQKTYLYKDYHWTRVRECKYHEFVELKVELDELIYNNFREDAIGHPILHIKTYQLLDTYFNIKFDNDY